jgi:hypothetical protein
MRDNQKGENRHFLDISEILKALENKDVSLHTKIIARIKNFKESC